MRLESIAELAHTFCLISADSSLSWYPFIYLGTDNEKSFLCKPRAGFVKLSNGKLCCLSIAYKKPLVHLQYSRFILPK